MYTVLVILILLIDASPAVLMIGEPFAAAIVAAVMAIAGVIIAFTLRRSDSNDLRRFFLTLAIAASLPAAWMLVQMVPTVTLGWAHPVWQSAAAALDTPLVGAFSIDRGLTVAALCNYLAAVAVMFVAAAVAVDRHRAKWILVALSGATTLVAIVVVIQGTTGVRLLSGLDERLSHDAGIDAAALGAILCAAAVARVLGGSNSLGPGHDVAASRKPALMASLVAFVICVSAVVCFGTTHALFAMAFGVATFLAVAAIRRLGLSSWGIAGVVAMMILVGSSIVVTQPRIATLDPTLAFADAPKSVLSMTERILADGSWTGSGAGSFKALVPIYKDWGELTDNDPPTLAAAIVVELGRAALWVIAAIATFGVVMLLRGALVRVRDWFYPAAGASCLCTATALAFSNIGLSATPSLIIVASTLGMAFGQSQSRATPRLSELSNFVESFTLRRNDGGSNRLGIISLVRGPG